MWRRDLIGIIQRNSGSSDDVIHAHRIKYSNRRMMYSVSSEDAFRFIWLVNSCLSEDDSGTSEDDSGSSEDAFGLIG